MVDLGNLQMVFNVTGGADNTSIWFNLISGNQYSGVDIIGVGTDFTSVYNNIIGSNLTTTIEISNNQRGVAVMDGPTKQRFNPMSLSGVSGLD